MKYRPTKNKQMKNKLSNSSAWYKGSNMKLNTCKRFVSPVEDFTIQIFPVVRNMTTAQRNVRQ